MALKTFKELQSIQSPIFESEMIEGLTPDQILEAEKVYSSILDIIKEGKDIDESFLGNILGGAGGAIAGPSIMKAICKALGLEKGPLYDLLTSRLILTAVGAHFGGKII